MRITIKDIEAKIIDSSTMDHDDFLIECWIVRYRVDFDNYAHSVEGRFEWNDPPFIKEILSTIKGFYV
jgi:hypothetical protein